MLAQPRSRCPRSWACRHMCTLSTLRNTFGSPAAQMHTAWGQIPWGSHFLFSVATLNPADTSLQGIYSTQERGDGTGAGGGDHPSSPPCSQREGCASENFTAETKSIDVSSLGDDQAGWTLGLDSETRLASWGRAPYWLRTWTQKAAFKSQPILRHNPSSVNLRGKLKILASAGR